MSFSSPSFVFECPPGTSEWGVGRARVVEALGRPYEGVVELLSKEPAEIPDDLFGQKCALSVTRDGEARRMTGFVTRVSSEGSTATQVRATVTFGPELTRLSYAPTSRMFQGRTTLQIIRDVLTEYEMYPGNRLRHEFDESKLLAREYCVQYRESTLAFVLRLLEDEGLTLCFEDDDAGEVMHIRDGGDPTQWPEIEGARLPVLGQGARSAGVESIIELVAERREGATGVHLHEFDWTQPRSTRGTAVDRGAPPHRALVDPGDVVFAGFDEGTPRYASNDSVRRGKVRGEELIARAATLGGHATSSRFSAGHRFHVTGHVDARLDAEYLLTRVVHECVAAEADALGGAQQAQARYVCGFECLPAPVVYRPPRRTPVPRAAGPETAIVEAEQHSTDEVNVDRHGRVRARFHWDRDRTDARVPSQRPQPASCWLRVVTPWAGPGYGMMAIPRVGMEVLVEFIGGNPDRPIVVGCVFNGENHVPMNLPNERSQSIWRTRTTPGARTHPERYNELAFEDLDGAEFVRLKAQRDHQEVVGNDQTVAVTRNHSTTIGGNETHAATGARTTTIQGRDGDTHNVTHALEVVVGERYTLRCGSSVIEVTPGKIRLTSGPATVELDGGTINITSAQLVNIVSTLVKINS